MEKSTPSIGCFNNKIGTSKKPRRSGLVGHLLECVGVVAEQARLSGHGVGAAADFTNAGTARAVVSASFTASPSAARAAEIDCDGEAMLTARVRRVSHRFSGTWCEMWCSRSLTVPMPVQSNLGADPARAQAGPLRYTQERHGRFPCPGRSTVRAES